MFYVYLLRAINPGINKSYVGYTNNLKLRLNKHNSNKGAKSTRGYKWLLIYSKKFKTKGKAMSYEYKLKNNQTLRNKIKESNYLNEKN
jgi:putative endonuclease